MNWIEALLQIKNAQDNNRLVVFVGSGVSKNSDIPTWGELVNVFADELGYLHCESCSESSNCNKRGECDFEKSFSQEEYLRIPEYYYQKDKSRGHNSYYKIIHDILDVEAPSNAIDGEIFKVLPHHIVTTNYDDLLESVGSFNAGLYKVVAKDEDILTVNNDRYIVKMHGDFSNNETIVLKESDYIKYEQDHILISTFIKSLLLDHTFLFLGYSLNDINLNLIIGWINYFAEHHGVSSRPQSFMLSTGGSSKNKYEEKRLNKKSINVIDLNKIPYEIVNELSSSDITADAGKRLQCFLRLLWDDSSFMKYTSSVEWLEKQLEMLEPYNYVSVKDLMKVGLFHRIDYKSASLIFYEEDSFDRFIAFYDNSQKLRNTLEKCCIRFFQLFGNDENTREINVNDPEENEIWKAYLNNDYIALRSMVKKSEDLDLRVYYAVYLRDYQDDSIKTARNSKARNDSVVSYLLFKIRLRMALIQNEHYYDAQIEKEIDAVFSTMSPKDRRATGYLYELAYSQSADINKMEEYLNKQEEHYQYKINGFRTAHAYTYIWDLQAYVYNFYFYFKNNYLPIDHFADSKKYFSSYIQAILCTYSPVSKESEDSFSLTHRENYPIGVIDLDIISKYSKPKDLQKWMSKYHVDGLLWEESVDFTRKFCNLCKSLTVIREQFIADQIHSFSLLLISTELDEHRQVRILESITDTFVALVYEKDRQFEMLLEPINRMLNSFNLEACSAGCDRLVAALFSGDSFDFTELLSITRFNELVKLINTCSDYVSDATRCAVVESIDRQEDENEKAKSICYLYKLLPYDQYKEYLKDHYICLNRGMVFELVIRRLLDYDEKIEEFFLSEIEKLYSERVSNPNVRTYPDWLKEMINEAIILHLIGTGFDIKKVEYLSGFSDHIAFILDPDSFDYSKVDTSDYMWQNLMKHDNYKSFFHEHRECLLDGMKTVFRNGNESIDQQKIAYGILLNEDELWRYPNN